MTIQINIEPAVRETLAAKAQAMGVPLESLIQDVLEREAKSQGSSASQERLDRDHRFQLGMAWLARNKARYQGKWIALEGPNLLACADTAKEVYSQVAGLPAPPLVVRVEEEEPPFAGW